MKITAPAETTKPRAWGVRAIHLAFTLLLSLVASQAHAIAISLGGVNGQVATVGDQIAVTVTLDTEATIGITLLSVGVLFDDTILSYNQAASSATSYILYNGSNPKANNYLKASSSCGGFPSPGGFYSNSGACSLRVNTTNQVNVEFVSTNLFDGTLSGNTGVALLSTLIFDVVAPGDGLAEIDLSITSTGNIIGVAGGGTTTATLSGGGAVELFPDSDGDGVVDPSDNCPGHPNTNQADTDEDGLGDACELISLRLGGVDGTVAGLGDQIAVTVTLDTQTATGINILSLATLFDDTQLSYNEAASSATSYILYDNFNPKANNYLKASSTCGGFPSPGGYLSNSGACSLRINTTNQVNVDFISVHLQDGTRSGNTGVALLATLIFDVVALGDGLAEVDLSITAPGNVIGRAGGISDSAILSGGGAVTLSPDFDSDGSLDLGNGQVAPDGNPFHSPTRPGGGDQGSLAIIEDLNSDGLLDMIAVNNNNRFFAAYYQGADGYPGFRNFVFDRGYLTKFADLDNNGFLDLLSFSNTDLGQLPVIAVRLADGNGGFVNAADASIYTAEHLVASLATGDVNNDGSEDVVTINSFLFSAPTTSSISVLLGSSPADGTLSPAVHYPGGFAPRQISLGDLDADGFLDIVTMSSSQPTTDPLGPLCVRLGIGDGTFGPLTCFGSSSDTIHAEPIAGSAPHLVDLNGDGALDAITDNGFNVKVWLGTGDGSFAAPAGYATSVGAGSPPGIGLTRGDGVKGIAVGDLDEDGDADLLVTIDFRGSCGPGCSADTLTTSAYLEVLSNAGDGTFSTSFTTLIASELANNADAKTSVALGDVTGDGVLDAWLVAHPFDSGNRVLVGRSTGDNCRQVSNPDQADIDDDGFGDVCDHDIDGDGVLNAADAFPTDAAATVDTDEDGDPDSLNGASTTGLVEDTDDDNDGLLDDDEAFWGTLPLVADTDGDGLSDGDEVNGLGTNPTKADSDGDGIPDGNDLAPLSHADCRTRNPNLVLVWGNTAPFGVDHEHSPGLGDRYLMNEGKTLPGLAADDLGLPATLAEDLRSGVQDLFTQARPNPPSLPTTSNGLTVTNHLTGPPPAVGTPGSPSLLYMIDRSAITDSNFGALDGFAWTGVNRFSRSCTGGLGSVIIDPGAVQADITANGYDAALASLVEHVAHEAGHLYGLRHVLRGGLAACTGEIHSGEPAVMDYIDDGTNAVLAQCASPGCPVTEPPDCSGQETGEHHNPLYHYLRYVVGDSTADLAGVGITPASWDQESVPVVTWEVQFNFACTLCNLIPLYNVRIMEVLSGGGEVVRQTYDVLTIEELNSLTIQLPKSSSLKLDASTTDPATLPPGETPPTNVVLETPLYPPPDREEPVTIVSTLLEVEATSPGVYTTSTLATDSNVAVTPIYEIHPSGTYDVSDPSIPGGTLISTSTYVPPLKVAAAPESVPEPAAGTALLVGIAALLALGRRRREAVKHFT